MRKSLLITLFLLCLFGVARAQVPSLQELAKATKFPVKNSVFKKSPKKAPVRTETPVFFEGFEGLTDQALPNGWTAIDSDGDGYNWYSLCGSDLAEMAYEGEGHVCSASYLSSALFPDNWLISPLLDLQGTFSVMMKAQDPSWAAEHFAIYLSTTGTNLSDFTIELVPETEATGEYMEYTADLSAYAGQQGYIAIRHFNVTDMFRLNVDNFAIYPGSSEPIELTVFPTAAATDNHVPAYMFYWNDFTKSQFVIPASELTALTGKEITSMKFYTTPSDVPYTSVSTADFFLKEVESETISTYIDKADATVVYSGTVNIVAAGDGGEMTITFSTPFTYNGGNLLIGCENTTDAGYKNIYFIGESGHTGAALYGSNGSSLDAVTVNSSNFLPKTTFYTGGSTPPVTAETPTNVAVSEITESSAKVSWDGAGDSFAYRYRLVAAPVPGEGNWYYYDNGTYGTSVGTGGGTFDWGIMIPAGTYEGTKVSKVKVYDGGNYNMTGTLTIYNDGTTAPENAVASQAVTFPGDTEDFIEFTVDATIDPTKNVWVIFSNESGAAYPAHASNDDSNDSNGRWVGLDGDWMDLAEAGLSGYTFMVRAYIETPVSAPMMADAVSKAANPNMPRRAKDAAWQEGSTSDNYVTLEGLEAETQYEVQVQSVVGSTNSEWSAAVNFTTLAAGVACDAPTDLAVSDITDQSATVSWNGDAASYEMEIGTEGSSSGEAVVYDFNDGLQGWTNLIVNTDGGEWLHSSNNPSAYDYSPYMNGGGFAMCYSYIDNDGAYDTDAYLVSPQTFDIVAGSELTFKANNANVSYPESISVCVAETTGTPTAADFTVVATPTVSTGYDDTPTEISVDLSAYAGKSIWIAFHDQNYDAYEIWIDDIAISGAKKRAITWTPVGEVSSPYELTGLDPETEYSVRVRSVCGGSTSEWVETSFTTLATGSVVEAPTDLTIDNITDQSATATWSGSNDSYNIRYREVATTTSDVATVILSADDVWGDGSGYQMLLDADANAFGSVIPETGALTAGGDVDESIYAEFEYKIPENADGALSTANMLVDASAQIEIPAGTYDWCITNPTPGDRMWIASAGGTVGGRADDYVFEGGKTYEFHVYLGSPNDKTDLTVTGAPAGEWTTVEGVASPYSLTGLTAEATYEVQVQGITGGNASEWTESVTFTTNEGAGIKGLSFNVQEEKWYTIDGRKLAKRPTTAGVYILNRSKVIIK